LNRLRCVCLLLAWLAVAGSVAPAGALPITLTLVPSSAVLIEGQTLTVDVVVAGLTELDGDFVEEIPLESFDLDLQFDTSRLQYTSLTFDTSLGDPDDSGETFVSGPGNPSDTGLVLMFEFSLLSTAQLLALQSAPFTLATIMFEALALPGSTELLLTGLDDSSLGSPGGVPRGIGFGLEAPSSLFVSILPEPGTAALVIAALVLLGWRERRARA
jgi:hypothetical protein